MSATLDTSLVHAYLAPCPVLSTAGRLYPVEVEYLSRPVDARRQPIWDTAAAAFDQLVRAGVDGDILVFMPGAYESCAPSMPLATSLPPAAGHCCRCMASCPAEQDRAVRPSAGRKVVVATNVAETSITIEGVRAVIDSGLARIARFDPHRGINTLYVEPISQAAADQRAGRAGRTAPGRCLRLWTAQEHRGRVVRGRKFGVSTSPKFF